MKNIRKAPEKLLLGLGPTLVDSQILRTLSEPTPGRPDKDFVPE